MLENDWSIGQCGYWFPFFSFAELFQSNLFETHTLVYSFRSSHCPLLTSSLKPPLLNFTYAQRSFATVKPILHSIQFTIARIGIRFNSSFSRFLPNSSMDHMIGQFLPRRRFFLTIYFSPSLWKYSH